MRTELIKCDKVQIKDTFWNQKMERVYKNIIPYQWNALNDLIPDAAKSHCIKNFQIAADITSGAVKREDLKEGFKGFVFQDSDVAKWLEAVAYSLTWHDDPELEKTADETIDLICSAQQPDGYLDTYYIINGLEKRFTNLADNHELYCLGHMLEAACAYYEARGKRKLLDAMIRYVDLVDQTFGPEEGKLKGYPGHEIVEMALVKLYEITKDEKHLKLAKFFVDERGKSPNYFEEEAKRNGNEFPWDESVFRYAYYQAHKPVREQKVAIGHAVRAVYLYSGLADVASHTQDEGLLETCKTLWENVCHKQMYVTGSIGSSPYGEAFTFDYDLPNDSVYGETCAAIGLVFFAMRMLRMEAKSEYADVMERALYNGVISGISLDGTKFFYVNPLEVLPEAITKDQGLRHVKGQRQKWFGCACCPPNIARLLASLGSYVYTRNEDTVWQHLYIGNHTDLEVDGKKVELNVETAYPWENTVSIKVKAEEGAAFYYNLRMPGWCKKFTVLKNGAEVEYSEKDGYACLKEKVKDGDEILVTLEMETVFVKSNPKIRQNVGKSALMRGPLVYCLEEPDNGKGLAAMHIGSAENLQVQYEPDVLGGINSITLTGCNEKATDTLYYTMDELACEAKELKFIPYYAWANREPGEMMVWVND